MNHNKRIVVDLDDTLSFTANRDWEHATPNVPLIERLNSLAEKGWLIDIVTARGQLSTSSPQLADAKYRKQIEKWLGIHSVRYNSLSFEKLLARYYIDDKGLTPEAFLGLDIGQIQNTKKIDAGQSGAELTYDSDYVYKEFDSFENAQEFPNWD